MAQSNCPFCGHDNPEGARFCNDCGSPLHLTPCAHCEAVNDDWAERCHKCGAVLAGGIAHEPVTIGAIVDTAAVSTRDVSAPTSLPHVPESLGQRIEFIDWRHEGPLRGGAEMPSPSRAHEFKPTRRVAARIDESDSQPPAPALFADITTPRRASSRIAPVLIAASLLAAGGGYLLYRGSAPAELPNAAPSTPSDNRESPMQADARDAPPATESAKAGSEPATAAPSRDTAAPASASAIAGTAPPSPPRDASAADGVAVSRVLQLTPKASAETASGARPSASANADENRAAVETKRIIARELGNVPGPRVSGAGTSESRAAEETNRLIARELGVLPAGRGPVPPAGYRN